MAETLAERYPDKQLRPQDARTRAHCCSNTAARCCLDRSPFSIADAFFAPVCMRLVTYALPVPAHIAAYIEHVRTLQDWIAGARAGQDFRAFEEPYRLQR